MPDSVGPAGGKCESERQQQPDDEQDHGTGNREGADVLKPPHWAGGLFVWGDQSGRTSAPMCPHWVQTIRAPSGLMGVSSEKRSPLSLPPWLQWMLAQYTRRSRQPSSADVSEGDGLECLAPARGHGPR